VIFLVYNKVMETYIDEEGDEVWDITECDVEKIQFQIASIIETRPETEVKHDFFLAIDPAPKCMGISKWDINIDKLHSVRFIKLFEEEEKLNKEVLVERLSKFIQSNKMGILDCKKVFVEYQYRGQYNIFIQNYLQATLKDKCVIIHPSTVKCHFKKYYTKLTKEEKASMTKAEKYRLKKKDSCYAVTKVIGFDLLGKIPKGKKDDTSEATLIAKFVSDKKDQYLN
jgi:hypothetical protein